MGKVLFAAVGLLSFASAWAQHGSSAQNMALLGHEELQGRSAYQPLVRENHGRWIAYVGHHGGKTLNTLTGREESYQFEPGVFCSEVGVAPRVGGTGEDDAYLVTLTVDMNRDLSECVVFRASDVGQGPIARAQLPERIASGTHSCWAPGDSLRGWA